MMVISSPIINNSAKRPMKSAAEVSVFSPLTFLVFGTGQSSLPD